jgi:hypothetical protein
MIIRNAETARTIVTVAASKASDLLVMHAKGLLMLMLMLAGRSVQAFLIMLKVPIVLAEFMRAVRALLLVRLRASHARGDVIGGREGPRRR